MGPSPLPDEIARATFADRHIGVSGRSRPRCSPSSATSRSTRWSTPRCRPRSASTRRSRSPTGSRRPEALARLRALGERNEVFTSLIGLGYSDTITPPVILRNVLENPAWYTAYTPYQPEISQGRLEALAQLPDDGHRPHRRWSSPTRRCSTRRPPRPRRWRCCTASTATGATCSSSTPTASRRRSRSCAPAPNRSASTWSSAIPHGEHVGADGCFGVLLQYPGASGRVRDHRALIDAARTRAARWSRSPPTCSRSRCSCRRARWAPTSWSGPSQRFGVPLGFGGPHAGVLRDARRVQAQAARPARRRVGRRRRAGPRYRLALQTREQHIRREKATSNICTAQVLLAVIAGLYAVVPRRRRAARDRASACTSSRCVLAASLRRARASRSCTTHFFDTLTRARARAAPTRSSARPRARGINLRVVDADTLGIALDETTTPEIVDEVCARVRRRRVVRRGRSRLDAIPAELRRTSAFLTHPVFTAHRSETRCCATSARSPTATSRSTAR